ncbi:DEAD/DEAH box helicase [Orrella daihaiensis]|uniref:DEAD/DEAH box helicase n=1 Tax=Orrella daihaiensis TaxID=2782176 RepID=A0ABY4AMV9_9BURK|nr:DEAD/DEAH box helicase [Orrella daihaiensis]
MQAIEQEGYTHPTPIQAKAIPEVLAGHDLMAAAQTGTGKTAGFTLPILQQLLAAGASKPVPGRPKVLILTPTRELAAQVQESVRTYGRHTRISSMVMFGGVNINPQITALKKPVDILVATPGRLLDHLSQKTLSLSDISVLVLDEADRMLDMGFIRDIRKILALLPSNRQNLLFSATFSDDIRQLARGVLRNPVEVSVNPPNTTAQRVEQTVHLVPQSDKRDVLSHIIRESGWHQVLVFTRTKHGANRLAERLVKDGLQAAAIHGNKSQAARTRALEGFKTGKVSVLVATDIAARGLDIDQLPQVVNFELPNVPEDYVHRIGRTGRAGAAGCALSLVDQDEVKYLKAIERLTKQTIEQKPAPTGWVRRAEPELPRPPRPVSNRPRNAQSDRSRARSASQTPGASAGRGRRRAANSPARASVSR